MKRRVLRVHWFLSTILVAGVAGCKGSSTTPKGEDPGATNLRMIGQAYGFHIDNRGGPPKNADELKSAIPEIANVDPEKMMISARDGEPFVIYYGTKFDSDGRNVVLAHEKTGKDGERYVLTQARMVVVYSDADFKNATFPPGAKR